MIQRQQLQPPKIAIIGMACVYPGAHSPEELWQNVLTGRRFFRKAPIERLPLNDYFDADPRSPGKTYCDQMAVITDWSFDPLEFHIPPVTVQASDMTHWLALSTAAAAIRDAGVDLATLDRTRIGVILGNTLAGEFARSHYLRFRWPYVERAIRRAMSNAYEPNQLNALLTAVRHNYESPLPEITEDSLPGNMGNTITGRICNHFDLGGGAYIVDGACSSSLLAVATACEHLVNGNMDLVFTGGVDVSLDPFEMVGFAKIQALATDEIRPYDARAGGMLAGEGCGILVLAREDDARAMGSRIYAVIRGWAYSSDGAGGITAPGVEGQLRALRRAYERAGYPISSIDLIEGHGTGTPVGDRVEIEAILRLLGETSCEHAIRIGSIKGNIGHCKAAAGAAGLIKTVMSLNRKILPPTTNCEHPNHVFGQSPGRLYPNLRGEAWTARAQPRRASVSAMGFGGSNCHITLEEVNPQDIPTQDDLTLLGSSQTSELILLGGDNMRELAERVDNLIPIADRICRAEMTDMAAALVQAHPAGAFRLAIIARSPRDLTASLRQVSHHLAGGECIDAVCDPSNGIWAGSPTPKLDLVALFPGQGSQRLNMGVDILQRYPFVQDLYERAERAVADLLPNGLRSNIDHNLWASDKPTQDKWETELRDTRVAQPAIVFSSLAMLRVLEFMGLKPSVAIGHSLGEISALCAAGICEDETAVRVAALRGKAMASLDLRDPGAMMALAAPPDKVQELIRPYGSSLVISNYNSPCQTVISGTSQAIGEMARVCQARGLRSRQLPVSHAFHSSIVAPAAKEYRQSLAGVSFRPLSGRVISTLTGKEVDSDANLRELLSRHVTHPVRFQEAVLEASKGNPALWIEIGPGAVLSGLAGEILGTERLQCQPTDLEGENSFHLLNCVLARAYVAGLPVSTDHLFSYRFHRSFALDSYAPVFITNPCERAVQPLEVSAVTDFPPSSATTEDQSTTQEGGDEANSALSWAISWLAQRTGFPEQTISVDARLRDDLNLDSIKATQLVLALSQRLHRRMPTTLTGLANASLCQVVEAILLSPSIEGASVQSGAPEPALANGLEPWVRTFQMKEIPAPLEGGPELPLPSGGSAMIVAEPQCPRALAIADHLHDLGLTPIVAETSSLSGRRQALDDLIVMVLLLPEADRSFLGCSPAEFNERLEGLAATLFRTFGWLVHGRNRELSGLHCIVLRPVLETEDVGCDLEAGSAFCKSLQLEYPSAQIKWISLPAAWPPDRWAEVTLHELQRPDNRVSFAYNRRGQRFTCAAVPITRSVEGSPTLRPDDVFLVTGGAKGITSQLAFELARLTKVKLALLGSSPMPHPSSAPAENEMLQSFERLEQEGIRHTYTQCDVTDAEAVRRAVTMIECELGPITGILHGAGVSEPHRFYDMDFEGLLWCLRVKVRGLYNLLRAVPLGQLKALHVISSVLGKTGMRSQADYTTANAWLDGAVRGFSAAHPGLQCLSLGYSVWDEIGMGKRLDWFLDVLLSAGVTPIHIEQGVAAYLDLVQHPQPASTFVITGRLTTELESNLFPRPDKPKGRYLEKVLRWIPGTEIVSEATLSNDIDLYMAEHVFEGTPIFPGVMAAEAMVEAAQACDGNKPLSAMRNLRFQQPLIVPPGGSLVIRTLALTEPAVDRGTSIRVAIRSEADGFKENYCEAECLLGAPLPHPANSLPCPALSDPLPLDPEDFAPVPLFQGRFFRRIVAVHVLEPEKETVTRVRIPESLQYFGGADEQCLATGSPAARDAFLQSGAIGLPPRFLPSQIGAMYFYGGLVPGSEVICRNRIVTKSEGEYHADLSVYSLGNDLIEEMQDIVLRTPHASVPLAGAASIPVTTIQAVASLRNILSVPHALEIVEHDEPMDGIDRGEMESEVIRMFPAPVSAARKASVLGNLVAAKRAACHFSQRYEDGELSPQQVSIRHHSDGKPELCFTDGRTPRSFAGVELSLADGAGLSAAWIGPAPAGVDIEAVEERDTETWWGLLGHDGCALALRLTEEVSEPFDRAATRVWTILESAKKASLFQGCTPNFELHVNEPWVLLKGSQDSRVVHFFSSVLAIKAMPGAGAVLTVAVQML